LRKSDISSTTFHRHKSDSTGGNDTDDPFKVLDTWGSIEQDPDYEEFSQKVFRMKFQGHTVLVVQPYKIMKKTSIVSHPSLRLAEAVALVQSIPNWKVVSAVAYSIRSWNSNPLFGSTNMWKIASKVKSDPRITAVVVSIDILNLDQLVLLQKSFGVPVYDRYTIVIQIFHNHAVSKAARLQVSMAEIPYLRQCLDGIPAGMEDRLGDDFAAIGGASRTSIERRRELLKRREHKIKTELENLARQRQVVRKGRARTNTPTVAIVGYTNAGKTSLIQVLTKELSIQPRNRLFATLDVSAHRSQLPSGLQLVYIDTVGFMSDLPDNLIQSFKATLEDAMYADLLLHVWDVSHPESELQIKHVTKVLSSLSVEEKTLQNMITIGNKIDKLSDSERESFVEKYPDVKLISCVTGQGVVELEKLIESNLIKVTNRRNIVLKVRSGGPEHVWLLENATVTGSDVDKDQNYMLVNTLMTEGELNKFKSYFIVRHKQKYIFE